MKIIFLCIVLILSISLKAEATLPAKKSKESGAISRIAEIYEVEHLEGHKIRVLFSAQERDGFQKFPITTIDRSMVKVDFTNTSTPPAEAKSLLLHGAGGNDLKRALYIGFSLHRQLKPKAIEELRFQVGELLKELPSERFTVSAISQDSARVIADVSPEKSDNVNRILQQLQSLEPEGEGPALSDTLCVAAERFHAWNLSHFKKSDQKVLVILSNPGDAPSQERFRGQNCWRSLVDQGVRLYFITFGQELSKSTFDLASVAQESGGYVHKVSGPVEMQAAAKNVMALLKSEYVVDVDAPDIALEDQPLELKIRISYHEEEFSSEIYNVGFVIPTLAKVFSAGKIEVDPADVEAKKIQEENAASLRRFMIWMGIGAALVIALAISLFKWLRYRSRTVDCNTCGSRVMKDHSTCAFRKPECVARLVVIGGPYAGQTIPIMKGDTNLARFPRNGMGVKINGSRIRWFRHGSIKLDGYKAIYAPVKPGKDRINGWIVNEPRLLGIGSVLTLGDQKLRFEVKPQLAAN